MDQAESDVPESFISSKAVGSLVAEQDRVRERIFPKILGSENGV